MTMTMTANGIVGLCLLAWLFAWLAHFSYHRASPTPAIVSILFFWFAVVPSIASLVSQLAERLLNSDGRPTSPKHEAILWAGLVGAGIATPIFIGTLLLRSASKREHALRLANTETTGTEQIDNAAVKDLER